MSCPRCAARHAAGIAGKCLPCWLHDTRAIERQLVAEDDPAWKRYARIALACALTVIAPTLFLLGAHFMSGLFSAVCR